MTGDALRATLVALAQAMRGAHEPWWIIGSAAVVLHGGETSVGDVDVLLAEADAARLLPAIGVEPSAGRADDRFRSAMFARWTVPPLPVEFMGGLAVRRAGAWSPIMLATRTAVDLDEQRVFVPERVELVWLLHRFGRAKDVARATLLERIVGGVETDPADPNRRARAGGSPESGARRS